MNDFYRSEAPGEFAVASADELCLSAKLLEDEARECGEDSALVDELHRLRAVQWTAEQLLEVLNAQVCMGREKDNKAVARLIASVSKPSVRCLIAGPVPL